jgi:chemotaxis family two-component system sensor kinase Cph1
MGQNDLQQRFAEQEHELHVHKAELQQQNEELRQINLELELAHNRYADLFEFAPVGYVVCSERGLIQNINRTGSIQLGALQSEAPQRKVQHPQLIGRQFALFLEAGQRAAFATLLSQVVQASGSENGSHQMEARMVREGGQTWDALLECTSLIAQGGLVARIVLTDVTVLKNAQRDTERRTGEVKLLNEELQTFLHAMTHDLTRPQRQVEAFAGLLGNSLHTLDEKSAKHLKHLLAAASDMGALTTSLTRFFQSGQPVGAEQALDLNRLMEVIFYETRPQVQGRQVTLTHDPLPTIQADRQSLHMVFTSLLGNAVKFTRPRTEASIHVGYQDAGDSHLFSVRDNGVGFDMRQSGRLFRVFERLHSDRDFEGQGLGLALARRIVERYHGRVWAESVLGEGATFWIELPKESSDEPGVTTPHW